MRRGDPPNFSGKPDSITDMESITDPPPRTRAPSAAEHEEATNCLAALAADGYYIGSAQRAKIPVPLPAEAKYTVLSIDDDPALIELLREYLSLEGYDVRTASDYNTIVAELLNPVAPDAILLDVTLPGMNGFDILVKLRRQPTYGSVPVILLTAHDKYEYVLRGFASGADGYVTKPFQFEALSAAIKAVLGTR